MLPEFDSFGDLPPGIHKASVAEFEARFGRFTTSDRRIRLLAAFRQLIENARFSGIVDRMIVGGSYVTSKQEPNDIDLVILLSGNVDLSVLTPTQYNMASRKALRRVLRGQELDVTVVRNVSTQIDAAD